MYAQTIERVSPAPRSAADHDPGELTFVTLDESGEIAYFTSPSQTSPGKRNTTAIDIFTSDTFCFCRAAECQRACWHVTHVADAWRRVAHRVRCQQLPIADLEAHGQTLAKHIVDADAAGQPWIAANLRQLLNTARLVWQERAAQAAPALLTFPVALDLAA